MLANFLFEYDKAWLPGSQYSGAKKKTPSARWINCYTDEQVKRYGYADSDNGNAFLVVVVR